MVSNRYHQTIHKTFKVSNDPLKQNFKQPEYQLILPKYNQGEAQPRIPKPNIKQTKYQTIPPAYITRLQPQGSYPETKLILKKNP